MRVVALVVALLCSGCMPVVQHGPWVRRGVSGGVGASGAVTGEVGGDTQFNPFFSFDGGMRLGITPNDSSYKGVGIGLQLPLLALLANEYDDSDLGFGFTKFLNVDGYFTGPQFGTTRTAAGATVSNYHLMPYVQAGKLDDWYATFSVMFIRETDVVIFAPSFTDVRRTSDGGVSHVSLTAGIGTDGNETVALAGLSVIFEFHRKHARP